MGQAGFAIVDQSCEARESPLVALAGGVMGKAKRSGRLLLTEAKDRNSDDEVRVGPDMGPKFVAQVSRERRRIRIWGWERIVNLIFTPPLCSHQGTF